MDCSLELDCRGLLPLIKLLALLEDQEGKLLKSQSRRYLVIRCSKQWHGRRELEIFICKNVYLAASLVDIFLMRGQPCT
jgi:hypothetical protein